jgi:hypothetical protein
MTTVVASLRDRVMVSDSCVSDGDRRYPGRKVWRVNGALIGFAGDEAD